MQPCFRFEQCDEITPCSLLHLILPTCNFLAQGSVRGSSTSQEFLASCSVANGQGLCLALALQCRWSNVKLGRGWGSLVKCHLEWHSPTEGLWIHGFELSYCLTGTWSASGLPVLCCYSTAAQYRDWFEAASNWCPCRIQLSALVCGSTQTYWNSHKSLGSSPRRIC